MNCATLDDAQRWLRHSRRSDNWHSCCTTHNCASKILRTCDRETSVIPSRLRTFASAGASIAARTLQMTALALLAFGAPSAQAATYYVDQTAGSDTNSGTTTSAPWKNVPGMAAYTGAGVLRPGDVVYFDKADTWLLTGAQGL